MAGFLARITGEGQDGVPRGPRDKAPTRDMAQGPLHPWVSTSPRGYGLPASWGLLSFQACAQ